MPFSGQMEGLHGTSTSDTIHYTVAPVRVITPMHHMQPCMSLGCAAGVSQDVRRQQLHPMNVMRLEATMTFSSCNAAQETLVHFFSLHGLSLVQHQHHCAATVLSAGFAGGYASQPNSVRAEPVWLQAD